MYFGMFDPTIVILIPAIIFALYAQGKVKSAYNRRSTTDGESPVIRLRV